MTMHSYGELAAQHRTGNCRVQRRGGSVMANGPTAKTTWSCDGCPLLHTKDWRFIEENDGVDSGTDATCGGAEGREISTYWHKGYPTPAWCPYPLPEKGQAR